MTSKKSDAAYSFGLECLDGLHMRIHIIGDRLEFLQNLLCFVHDGLVFQDRAIVGEVDGSGLG